MIEFKRNEKTGILEVWKDGQYFCDIITLGDEFAEERGTNESRND